MLKKKLVIGFAGKKQAGKTTAARALQSMFSEHTEILSFAAPLKVLCKDMFGLTQEQMTDPVKKEIVDPRWNLSPRQTMQRVGKMFRDNFGEEYWVRKLVAEMNRVNKPIIIIDDVRYMEELQVCDSVFFVQRPSQQLVDKHESENPPPELMEIPILNIQPTVSEYCRFIRGSVIVRIIEEHLNGTD